MASKTKSCPVLKRGQQKADGSRIKNRRDKSHNKDTGLSNNCCFLSSTFDSGIFSQTAQSGTFWWLQQQQRGKKKKKKRNRRTNMHNFWLFMVCLEQRLPAIPPHCTPAAAGLPPPACCFVMLHLWHSCFVSAFVCIIAALTGRCTVESGSEDESVRDQMRGY